jgi:hypothetical protein
MAKFFSWNLLLSIFYGYYKVIKMNQCNDSLLFEVR